MIQRFNSYEIPLELVFKVLHGRHMNTVFELGAHDGATLEKLVPVLTPALYLAVDADVRNAVPLFAKARAAGKNHTRSVIARCPLAVVGSHVDMVLLHPSQAPDRGSEWTQSSTTRRPTGHLEQFPWVQFAAPVPVPAITLSGLAQLNCVRRIDFLWMDVEGAEREILETCPAELLPQALYMEAHTERLHEDAWTREEALAWLTPRYELLAESKQDLFLWRRL